MNLQDETWISAERRCWAQADAEHIAGTDEQHSGSSPEQLRHFWSHHIYLPLNTAKPL